MPRTWSNNSGLALSASNLNALEADVTAALGVPDAALAARVQAGATKTALDARYATNTALAGKEPAIPAGTTGQFFRGDKTWVTISIDDSIVHPKDGRNLVKLPALSGLGSMITDVNSYLVDGAKFFTIIDVQDKLGSPLDNYYGYVSGHNSVVIWLVTAPSPEGPWTWRQSVRTLANSPLINNDHVSSPEVIWFDNKFHLYYHGSRPVASGTGQPTVVATSTDGVAFTEHATMALPTAYEVDRTRHYAVSTSYARIANVGGKLVAVFQANNNLTNQQNSNAATTSVGFATSTDGLAWQISPVPLITNKPGESGPFGPNIAKINGLWWLWAYFPSRGSVDLYVSETLKPGTFRHIGPWFTPPAGFDWVDSPTLHWFDGVPHIYFGATDTTYTVPGETYHAILDWTV